MNKSINDPIIAGVVDQVFELIQPLNPWVYYTSLNDSVYVKFDVPYAPAVGTLRVADHVGLKKYRYKWNIIAGYSGKQTKSDRGVRRYFYSPEQLDIFAAHIMQLHRGTK